jgi:hypothetical protein
MPSQRVAVRVKARMHGIRIRRQRVAVAFRRSQVRKAAFRRNQLLHASVSSQRMQVRQQMAFGVQHLQIICHWSQGHRQDQNKRAQGTFIRQAL